MFAVGRLDDGGKVGSKTFGGDGTGVTECQLIYSLHDLMIKKEERYEAEREGVRRREAWSPCEQGRLVPLVRGGQGVDIKVGQEGRRAMGIPLDRGNRGEKKGRDEE